MVTLKYNGAEMTIARYGAEMKSFRAANGREYIWPGHPDYWTSSAPVLFPAIGALKNGGATINGKWCPVGRHGFAKFNTFEVTDQGEDYVTMTLTQNEETKKVFPFDFALHVTHRFLPNGFETRFTVENHSEAVMPFLIGGHPGFICPMNEGECFEDYIVRFEQEEKGETVLCNGPGFTLAGTEPVDLGADHRTLSLDYEAFARLDTYIFSGLNSRSVDFIHKETQKGLRFFFDMDVLAIWTKGSARAPYLCIEPWQGSPAYANESGRFEDKPYHVELGKDQTYSCGYRMETLD